MDQVYLNSEYFTIKTPVGPFSVIVVDEFVRAAGFANAQSLWLRLAKRLPVKQPKAVAKHPYKTKFQAYFNGEVTALSGINFEQIGTEFSLAVWSKINQIKPGQTISYQTLAKKIGRPNAVRAVGTACGRNLIAVLVPCHRVIGSNGDTSKYAYGSKAKAWLLALEKGLVFIPVGVTKVDG